MKVYCLVEMVLIIWKIYHFQVLILLMEAKIFEKIKDKLIKIDTNDGTLTTGISIIV